MTINGARGLSLTIDNSNAGHIGTGGNITVTTGGGVTADSLFTFINNRNGGTIDSGGNLTFSIGDALTTTGDAVFITSNRSLGGSGGTMGANVTLALHAVSFSVGGDLTAAISTNAGGHIVGSAFNNITIDGNVTIQGTAQIDIENSGILVSPGNFVGGGTIGSDAVLNITAGNIFVGGSFFDVGISYDSGALIGGNALVNFAVSGNVTTPGEESFTIGKSNNDGVTNAGTIGSNAIINVSAASISTGGRLIGEIDNTGGSIGESAIINFSLSGNLTTQSDATFSIYNSNGGAIGLDAVMSVSAGGVSVDGNLTATINNRDGSIGGDSAIIFDLSDLNVSGNASFTITQTPVALSRAVSGLSSISSIDVTANSITVGGDLNAYIDNSFNGGTTFDDGSNVHLESFGGINITGRLNVLGTVLADGDVNVGTLSVTNLDTQGNNTIVGPGGITPFSIPGQLAPDILHTLTTRLLSSAGGINFDGVAAVGDFSLATNGGALTVNALTLSFGSLPLRVSGFIPFSPDIVGSVSFNGGDGSFTFGPGNGGTFTVNTTSDITVNSDIEATSGRIQPGANPSGAGGEVNLNSSNGTVTVNNRVQVSSAEPSSTIAPVRQSAKGGRIGITSAKTSGVAINIGSSAQLLSLLNAAAPGPGGSIKIVASKAGSNGTNSSSININNANGDPGAIVADRGTVEIRHDGDGGAININNANIRADVVKVGALGLNGTLNIGGGNINADTILKLYATGSNGQLNFISDVTLSSGTAMHLAANTITIQPSIIVTINGTGGPANVYTNHPNYSGFGGTTAANGTFAGNGAHLPQPLGNAPGF